MDVTVFVFRQISFRSLFLCVCCGLGEGPTVMPINVSLSFSFAVYMIP